MNRGEVWWAERPEEGRRPYVILTRQSAIPVLNGVLAVPATRTARGIPTEVRVGVEDGMPEECVLSLDKMTVVRKSLLVERICRLRIERLRELCGALGVATGCE